MHESHDLLKAITVVLVASAATTVLFQRLRQPVVLGYILAGLIVGPHVPIPLVADPRIIQTLSELGVILLMFSLGLEFSLRKLIQLGPTAGVTAVIQSSLMVWLGFVVGRALGWTSLESLFAGAVIAISSTTIIAKAFDEQGIRGRLRETVVGVLIVEDLIAILLMASLTAVATGGGLSARELLFTVGRLAAFLVGLVVVGMLVIPRTVRMVQRLNRPEITVVSSVAICFGVALLANAFGYSVALGAFLAGSLVGESGDAKAIEHQVQPVKDVFAAVFFVSVGMLIDPALLLEHWVAIAAFTLAVLLGKIGSVSLGAFLTGSGTRTSVQAGLSLAQIGEFSFIIAGLGLALGATRPFLYPVAVAVSAITTLTTPWLIRFSGPVASYVDRTLPRPLQTFAALYGSWIQDLGASRRRGSGPARLGALVRLLVLDAAAIAGLVIGTSLALPSITRELAARLELEAGMVRGLVLLLAVLVAVPFGAGLARIARRLGAAIAAKAFPAAADGKVDLAAAPRRAFVVTLQLGLVLAVGIPLVALTQPFLPGLIGAAVLLGALVLLGVSFWRSATNLEGHVRAGTQAVIEALAAQGRQTAEAPGGTALEDVRRLLPGIGEPVAVRLADGAPAVGRTLGELNLRGATGATALAIRRGQEGVVPTAAEALRAGDVLVLAGTDEAIAAARELLLRPSAGPPNAG
jgi:CPA2 family monovalent cation:H+ antiporter-2